MKRLLLIPLLFEACTATPNPKSGPTPSSPDELARKLSKAEGVTAEMILAAHPLSETTLLDPLMDYLAATHPLSGTPQFLAVQYVANAARHGQMKALDFLSRLVEDASPPLRREVEIELAIIAGKVTPKSWRAWYLQNAQRRRWHWLKDAMGEKIGEPFDVTNRAHLDRLIACLHPDEMLEPEFSFLEPLLGRRFGYVWSRDVPPGSCTQDLDASNARALETLRAWWSENARYAWYDPRSASWDVNAEARDRGTPVDPKTGKP